MRDFGVYEEVNATTVDDYVRSFAITTRFVCREKGDEVRARFVVQDYLREVEDQDEIYASTPLLTTVKILLMVALQFGWGILLGDLSTAFLHAEAPSDYYVWPPKEYYPDRTKFW